MEAFFSPIGRPAVDLETHIRMLIDGYCFGIRSERRLCEEVHLNLAYRGRSSSRVTSRHFDHGNGSRAFTFKLFRSG